MSNVPSQPTPPNNPKRRRLMLLAAFIELPLLVIIATYIFIKMSPKAGPELKSAIENLLPAQLRP